MISGANGPPLPRVNILLVDDQPANLLALEAILAEVDAHLIRAGSGEEALKRVLEEDFAVILMDVRMPGMNGYEAARLIRNRDRSRHTPIIFVTAHETNDAVLIDAYRRGAADHLTKPLIPEILRAKVVGFVERAQMAEQMKRQSEALRRMEAHEYERKLAEERQRWELDRLREETRRKDEFIAMLGHELRNPLAPIRNAIQILRHVGAKGPVPEQAQEIIDRQVKHMARLVDDLLDVSRVTRGTITLQRARVALPLVVEHAIETCRPLLSARGHQLSVSLPPKSVQVDVDPDRLKQVLTNLLTNAAKYTQSNGQISLTAECSDLEVCLRVRDNGVGIPPDKLASVFEIFTQLDSAPTDGPRWGLGIGLTLVKKLVELHGGTVSVSSAGPGRGSEFVVRLPNLLMAGREAERAGA